MCFGPSEFSITVCPYWSRLAQSMRGNLRSVLSLSPSLSLPSNGPLNWQPLGKLKAWWLLRNPLRIVVCALLFHTSTHSRPSWKAERCSTNITKQKRWERNPLETAEKLFLDPASMEQCSKEQQCWLHSRRCVSSSILVFFLFANLASLWCFSIRIIGDDWVRKADLLF